MTRLLTGLTLIPFAAYAILFAPQWVFTVVVVALAAVCFHEYSGIATAYKLEINRAAGYGLGVILLLWNGDLARLYILAMLVALVLALHVSDMALSLPSAGALLLGVAYVFGSWRTAIELHKLSPYWLLFAITINWIGDTAAYYAGRALGRRKLLPRVSPAKSWEGAYASLIGSATYGVVVLYWLIPAVTLWEAIGVSVCANIAGQVGDLAESALKRGAGVKDSGTLLPGHGGWLDRLDSTLFSMPVVYLWLTRAN